MPAEIIYPKVEVDGLKESTTIKNDIKEERRGSMYCSDGHLYESNWLVPLGFKMTSKIEDADVVVFGGGQDIDHRFYNQARGKYTGGPTRRDIVEKRDFDIVQGLIKEGKDVKCVGICRGHQLLCALAGGSLIQHVGDNHIGHHSMTTYNKNEFIVNSIHHQMIYPYNLPKKEYKILGWSTKPIASEYLNGGNKPMWLDEAFKEIEIVYFPKIKSLGIQSHPEMMFRNQSYDKFMGWLQDLFLKFFNNEL